MTFLGIPDNIAQLFLSVVTAIADMVVNIRVASQDGARAVGTHLRELGVALDFYAPTLIVGEVEVQHIHVVHGQQVDVLLDEVGIEEMADHIEVHAPVYETRTVGDIRSRQQHLFTDRVAGQCFSEHLDAVEDTGRHGSTNSDAFLTDADVIALCRGHGRVKTEGDGVPSLSTARLQLNACVRTDILLQELSIAQHLVFVVSNNNGIFVKNKGFPLF